MLVGKLLVKLYIHYVYKNNGSKETFPIYSEVKKKLGIKNKQFSKFPTAIGTEVGTGNILYTGVCAWKNTERIHRKLVILTFIPWAWGWGSYVLSVSLFLSYNFLVYVLLLY